MIEMVLQTGLFLSISAVPLVLALGLLIWPRWQFLSVLAQWAALPGLLCALLLPWATDISLPWLLLGVQLGIDAATRTFLFFTGLLWLTAGIFAGSYLAHDQNKRRFLVFFLLAMGGNLGLVVAQDMLSFYMFFALMSFASYGLITHERTANAWRAGRIYIVMVIAGELMLFAGLVLAAQHAGSILFADAAPALATAPARDLIFALLLGGFGIKLGVLGLHVWLPLAHPVAPTPASAVLSGAMIKAGLLGWLNLLPLGTVPLNGWGAALMAVGLLAVFYAAVIGVTQRNPKTVLAYSSISQMGLATCAVGMGLAAPHHWPEISAIIVFFALNHALAKSTLFLGVGIAAGRLTGNWQRGLVVAGLAVPALALAGAPFSGGGLVKELLSAQAASIAAPWGDLLKTLLSWTVLATVILMARFLYLIWPRADVTARAPAVGMVLPSAVLIGTLLLAPSFFGPAGTASIWIAPIIQSSLTNLTLALLAAVFGGWLVARSGTDRILRLPAGDLVVLAERAAVSIFAIGRRLLAAFDRLYRGGGAMLHARWQRLRWPVAPDYAMELAWTSASLLFLLLLVVFMLAAA